MATKDAVTKQVNIYWRRTRAKIVVKSGNTDPVNETIDYTTHGFREKVKDLVRVYLQHGYKLNIHADTKNKRLDKSAEALRHSTESKLYELIQAAEVAA